MIKLPNTRGPSACLYNQKIFFEGALASETDFIKGLLLYNAVFTRGCLVFI